MGFVRDFLAITGIFATAYALLVLGHGFGL